MNITFYVQSRSESERQSIIILQKHKAIVYSLDGVSRYNSQLTVTVIVNDSLAEQCITELEQVDGVTFPKV